MVIYCEYCSHANSDDSNFCVKCGRELASPDDGLYEDEYMLFLMDR